MKNKHVIIICIAALTMLTIVATMYLTIAGKNLAETLPAIGGFTTPTIVALAGLIMNQSALANNLNLMETEIKPKVENLAPVVDKIEPAIASIAEKLEVEYEHEHNHQCNGGDCPRSLGNNGG